MAIQCCWETNSYTEIERPNGYETIKHNLEEMESGGVFGNEEDSVNLPGLFTAKKK